jgi:hypothetical protein
MAVDERLPEALLSPEHEMARSPRNASGVTAMTDSPTFLRRWWPVAAVFVVVLVAQLWLVAVAGTDIPFHDQWGIEGRWLYPAWCEGSLRPVDLVQPFNEHRILWTHLLNLALFVANGQWDPLVQLAAIAGLRALCAAGIVWLTGAKWGRRDRDVAAVAVTFAFLPHLAWHNALWGIESHAYFVLGFSVLTLALLSAKDRSRRQTWGGLAAGGAALLAMGPGALVPVALLGLVALGLGESRRLDRTVWQQAWPALVLLGASWVLRAPVPEHTRLAAATASQFFSAVGRVLGWPHVGEPLAALPMNLPLLLVVSGRLLRRRSVVAGENFVLLLAGWSVAVALATAWVRGGSDELAAGVPSRYVDFIVLLPLANAWCAVQLTREALPRWQARGRLAAGIWCVFLLIGWLGLSAEVIRGIVLPRMHDREAPVRLTRAFQLSGDPAVFAGQPRLLVPHPNPKAVRAVLDDPRLRGRLPPSLQPDRPMGPLSRATRALLGR